MPISTRYDTIMTQLTSQLPTLRSRLSNPLVCALVGMSQSVSAQQRAIAGAMPLKTKQQSKIQRLRRLLDTATLTATDVYQPIVRSGRADQDPKCAGGQCGVSPPLSATGLAHSAASGVEPSDRSTEAAARGGQAVASRRAHYRACR